MRAVPTRTSVGPNGVVSPKEARSLLGVSHRRLQQFREQGRLRTYVQGDGTHYFDRAQVTAMALERAMSRDPRLKRARLPPSMTALVFGYFDSGAKLSAIVQATELDPNTIRDLWDQYKTPLGQRPAPPTVRKVHDEETDQHREIMAKLEADYDAALARRRQTG